jgi:hypothetical protein
VGKVSVDRPCIVYYEETTDGLTLAVSDPTHASATLHVTIDAPLTGAQLPPEATSEIVEGKTRVTYRVEKGRNYLVRFASRKQ